MGIIHIFKKNPYFHLLNVFLLYDIYHVSILHLVNSYYICLLDNQGEVIFTISGS